MPDFEEKKDNPGLPFEANHRGGVVSEPTLTKEHGNEERNIVSCSLIIFLFCYPIIAVAMVRLDFTNYLSSNVSQFISRLLFII